jgi:hypothetical protein
MPIDRHPPENPPADRRTVSDRLSDASVVVWAVLGGLVLCGFALLVIWLH